MGMRRVTRSALVYTICLGSILVTGCNNEDKNKPPAGKEENNVLTDKEKQQGWKLLFDGKTFDGWKGIGRETVPGHLWKVEDGAIRKINTGEVESLSDGQPAEGGDLMTVEAFDNFELYFEWKVSKAGNTGVKYNVSEEMSTQYLTGYSAIGFEYQLSDDKVDGKENAKPSHLVGALYDLIPAQDKVVVKPLDEYNASRIVVDGDHVEHWLNGIKIVEFEFGSSRMDSLYELSKYKEYPGFLQKRKGHIVLQNHKDDAWFRNIKLRELSAERVNRE